MTEQQQTTEEQQQTTHDDLNGPSDAELLAALREAGGTESVDVEAEEKAAAERTAAAAAPKPKEGVPAAEGEPATDPDEPKIAATLRAREKAFRERQEAESYAARLKAQAEAEATRIREEAKERARLEHEEYLRQQREKFASSPTEYLRTLAKDPNEIVDAVNREGTPEWRALRAMQAQLAEATEKARGAEQVKAEFERWKEEQAQQAHQQRIEQVKATFLAHHASPEKAPYLHKRYEPEEIFAKADALARQWQRAGIDFAHSDIVEYLEHESRKRLGAVASPPQQVSGASGNAPKVKANGSRTLSAASGSERRATPKPIDEMSPEEERNFLLAELKDVRATLKTE